MPQPSSSGDLDMVMEVAVVGRTQPGPASSATRHTIRWVIGAGALVAVVVGLLAWNPDATLEVERAMIVRDGEPAAPLGDMPTGGVAEAWSLDLEDGERVEQLAVTSDAIVGVVVGESAAAATMRAWDRDTGGERWRLDAIGRDDLAPAVRERAMPHVLADDTIISFDGWSQGRLTHRVVRVEDGSDAWATSQRGFLMVHPWRRQVVSVPLPSAAFFDAPVGVLVDLDPLQVREIAGFWESWRGGWVSVDDREDREWTVRGGDADMAELASDWAPVRLGAGWLTVLDEELVAVADDGSRRWSIAKPSNMARLHGLETAAVIESRVVSGDGSSSSGQQAMRLVEPFGRVTALPNLDPWLVRRYGLIASPALPAGAPIVQLCTGADTIRVTRPCPGEVEVRSLDGDVVAQRTVSPLQRFEDGTNPVTPTAQGLALLTRDGVLGLDWSTLDTMWRIDRQGLRREPQITRWATSADGVAVAGVGDDPGAPNFLAWYAP